MKRIWKAKVILDSRIREEIEKFYKVSLPVSVEGTECFSHPDLDRHTCNPRVEDCSICWNSFARRCLTTCHINRFCWAVFAYRLGIGGADLGSAIEHNLSKSHEWLWQQVMDRYASLSRGEDEEIHDGLQLPLVFPVSEVPEPEEEDLPDVELISLTEAAAVYGCTYCNIYSHVKRGNLRKYEKNGQQCVEKAAVLELRSKRS